MRVRAIRALVGVVMVLLVPSCIVPTSVRGETLTQVQDWELEMFLSINAARSAAGVAPLTLCTPLRQTSLEHSQNLATRTADATTTARTHGYVGAVQQTRLSASGAPQRVVANLLRNRARRAALLSTSVTDIGVARAAAKKGRTTWVITFGAGGAC